MPRSPGSMRPRLSPATRSRSRTRTTATAAATGCTVTWPCEATRRRLAQGGVVWSVVPRGTIYEATEFGSDSRISEMCARGNQSYDEFCADGIGGHNYGSGNPVEVFKVGTTYHAGTSDGLSEIKDMLQNGHSVVECAKSNIGGVDIIRYANAIKTFATLVQPEREGFEHVKVTVLCGPAGSGKTRYVQEKYRAGVLYLCVDAVGHERRQGLVVRKILGSAHRALRRISRPDRLQHHAYLRC
eukprot:scaffold5762_cov101-Isochrysis_galbana.AAC.4